MILNVFSNVNSPSSFTGIIHLVCCASSDRISHKKTVIKEERATQILEYYSHRLSIDSLSTRCHSRMSRARKCWTRKRPGNQWTMWVMWVVWVWILVCIPTPTSHVPILSFDGNLSLFPLRKSRVWIYNKKEWRFHWLLNHSKTLNRPFGPLCSWGHFSTIFLQIWYIMG